MNKREFVTKHLKFKCFVTVGFTFVYSLSTESLAYNLTEDASRFLLYFIPFHGKLRFYLTNKVK